MMPTQSHGFQGEIISLSVTKNMHISNPMFLHFECEKLREWNDQSKKKKFFLIALLNISGIWFYTLNYYTMLNH